MQLKALGLLVVLVCQCAAQVCPEVTVNETLFTSPIVDFFWHEIGDTAIVYATTWGDVPTVWRSGNDGQTWEDLSAPHNLTNLFIYNILTGWKSGEVFFHGYMGDLWYSDNGGTNLTHFDTSFVIDSLYVHPTTPGWLLADELSYCKGIPRLCYKVYFSSNNGQNWTFIKDSVGMVSWGAAGTLVPVGTVYMIQYTLDANQRFLPKYTFSDNIFGLLSSDGSFNSAPQNSAPKSSVDYVESFLPMASGPIFLLKVDKTYITSLWISTDLGVTFVPIQFPGSQDISIVGFSIISVENGNLLYGVLRQDKENKRRIADIYSSDTFGSEFDLSLPNVVVSNGVQFQKLGQIDGVYIANAYVFNPSTLQEEITTLITYDSGSVWYTLKPPTGETCSDDISEGCSLNLVNSGALVSSNIYEGMKSQSPAVGLIISTGQVSHGITQLEYNALFLSTDAGLSWKSVYPTGDYSYSYINHGSIILIVDTTLSDKFHYSTTYGQDFTTCDFPSSLYSQNVIFSEVSSSHKGFFIASYDQTTTSTKVVFLSFRDVLPRNCSDSDFEDFYPRSPSGSECVLGKTYHFQRRIPGKECWVPFDNYNVVVEGVCNCTADDFKCGICYKREPFTYSSIGENRYCYWYCASTINPAPVPDQCSLPYGDPKKITHYRTNSTSPYVKNGASECVAGIDMVNDPRYFWVGCPALVSAPVAPAPTPNQLSVGAIIGISVACGVVLLVLTVFVTVKVVTYNKGKYEIQTDERSKEEASRTDQ